MNARDASASDVGLPAITRLPNATAAHATASRAMTGFARVFGHAPQAVFQAPGRVNLIGEHTDYNDGFVLPCAIDFGTVVAIAPRNDDRVHVVACDYDHAIDRFHLEQPIPHSPVGGWTDYVRGVLALLRESGAPARGADLSIAGDVPRGAGLSSSASLEVALATAFVQLHALPGWDATRVAQLAQRAENEFVGCNCGIMDQLISAQGQTDHALLIDCRSLHTQAVPLPDDMAVMIVHSHVPRGLVDSEYNLRRTQCEAAATHLRVRMLRDADEALLHARGQGMSHIVWRRARHVISENARTLAAAQALAAGDLPLMGQLMAQSHASMRDDFQITVPAIDELVQILQAAIGPEGGARMTGGGFGGCVVALLPLQRVEQVRAEVLHRYRSPDGQQAAVYVCQAAAGAGPILLEAEAVALSR